MIVYFDCVAFREFLDDVSHSSFFTLSPVITLHIFYGVVLWLRKGCAVGSRGSAREGYSSCTPESWRFKDVRAGWSVNCCIVNKVKSAL